MLDWLLHPIAIYGFIAAVIGLNFYLFVTLKLEHTAALAAAERRAQALETALEGLRQQLSVLQRDAAREQVAIEPPAAVQLPEGDLNLTRRSQALRLARRGEGPERIAALLGIPRNEVDLLLKVQEIITGTLEAPAAR